MNTLIFVASAALAALAFAFVEQRDSATSRSPEPDVLRRVATIVVLGSSVVLLLGWAASAVDIDSSALPVFLVLTAFLGIGLGFAVRSGALH